MVKSTMTQLWYVLLVSTGLLLAAVVGEAGGQAIQPVVGSVHIAHHRHRPPTGRNHHSIPVP